MKNNPNRDESLSIKSQKGNLYLQPNSLQFSHNFNRLLLEERRKKLRVSKNLTQNFSRQNPALAESPLSFRIPISLRPETSSNYGLIELST